MKKKIRVTLYSTPLQSKLQLNQAENQRQLRRISFSLLIDTYKKFILCYLNSILMFINYWKLVIKSAQYNTIQFLVLPKFNTIWTHLYCITIQFTLYWPTLQSINISTHSVRISASVLMSANNNFQLMFPFCCTTPQCCTRECNLCFFVIVLNSEGEI